MRIISLVWLLALAAILFSETVKSQLQLPDLISNETYTYYPESGESSLNYRLPNETYPEHYDIKLTTNFHTGKEEFFQGKVIIDIVVVATTKNIVLHASEIRISRVNIEYVSTGESEELIHEYELERQFLILRRLKNKIFAAGTKWKLTITYRAELSPHQTGFFITKYLDDEDKQHYLVSTHFESSNARLAFPCYDEPAKRANFTITINHSPHYTAISNMPVNEALSSSTKTVFLTTPPTSTYMLGFVVSDFEYTEGILNGLRQRVYFRPNTKHNFPLHSAMLLTKYFSEYCDVEFMLPKLDHVTIPDLFPGGMENWGVSIYREHYNELTSVVNEETIKTMIVAHEVAHQWLGNYVTIQWWACLWIKEGLTTLFSYKALDNIYPEWSAWQGFHTRYYQNGLVIDSTYTTAALSHYVQKQMEINEKFGELSYAKGGSVFLMWNSALTEKVFKKSIQNFLKNNQYNAAAEEQLFSEIQNAADEENYELPATISEMMSTWSYQGGYPILTVTRDYIGGTFIIKQEAFYADENFKDDKTWYVPYNFAVASSPDFRDTKATHYLLNITEVKVAAGIAKTDWLVLNKQSTGFYRINYDAENYNLITECLIERPFLIHWRNRAQLMDDAYHLSISNRLNHSILLDMMTYLKREDQYAPWKTANSIISKYNRYLKNQDDYQFFVSELVRPIFQRLGVDEIPGEHHYDKHIRDIIINMACAAGIKECLIETSNKLKNLIERNIPIEPNLEKTIYCNGLIQSGDEQFNFIYQILMYDIADDSLLYVDHFGCSRNKNHIKKFISIYLDDSNNLLTSDSIMILQSIYSHSEVGLLACIEVLNENLDAYPEINAALERDIRGMAEYVVNKYTEEKFMALVAKVMNHKSVTDSLEIYVKDVIAKNFKWLQDHGEPIMSWMSQYRAMSSKSSQIHRINFSFSARSTLSFNANPFSVQ